MKLECIIWDKTGLSFALSCLVLSYRGDYAHCRLNRVLTWPCSGGFSEEMASATMRQDKVRRESRGVGHFKRILSPGDDRQSFKGDRGAVLCAYHWKKDGSMLGGVVGLRQSMLSSFLLLLPYVMRAGPSTSHTPNLLPCYQFQELSPIVKIGHRVQRASSASFSSCI